MGLARRQYIPIVLLSAALTGTGFALPPQADQSAKQDMKDAGHSTKDAAKDTGRGDQENCEENRACSKDGLQEGG